MILTGKANEMLAVRADTGAPSPAASATGTSGTGVGAHPTAGDVGPAFRQRDPVRLPGPARLGHGRLDGSRVGRNPRRRHGGRAPGDLAPGPERQLDAGVGGHPGHADRRGRAGLGGRRPGGLDRRRRRVRRRGDGTGDLRLRRRPAAAAAHRPDRSGRGGHRVPRGRRLLLRLCGRRQADGPRGAQPSPSSGTRPTCKPGPQTTTTGWTAGWVQSPPTPLSPPPAASSRSAPTARISRCGSRPTVGTWDLDYVAVPACAASATLRSVAATGTHVVAGYAATPDGDIPVVVVPPDHGVRTRARSCSRRLSGLGVITALTATPNGFTAAGVVGRGAHSTPSPGPHRTA